MLLISKSARVLAKGTIFVPPENSEQPKVEGILPNEPQRSMGLRTLLESNHARCLCL